MSSDFLEAALRFLVPDFLEDVLVFLREVLTFLVPISFLEGVVDLILRLDFGVIFDALGELRLLVFTPFLFFPRVGVFKRILGLVVTAPLLSFLVFGDGFALPKVFLPVETGFLEGFVDFLFPKVGVRLRGELLPDFKSVLVMLKMQPKISEDLEKKFHDRTQRSKRKVLRKFPEDLNKS